MSQAPSPKRPTSRPDGVRWGVALFSVLGIALGLCACATPYRPANRGKGYTDSQISSNEFQVGFQGNRNTTLEEVYDFALLRSAEVVLQHGCHFFAVMDATNTSSARSYIAHQRYYTGSTLFGPLNLPMHGPYGPSPSGYIVDVREPRVDFRPGTLLRIKGFVSKPAKPFTYDAAELEQTLRQKHKLKS